MSSALRTLQQTASTAGKQGGTVVATAMLRACTLLVHSMTRDLFCARPDTLLDAGKTVPPYATLPAAGGRGNSQLICQLCLSAQV
jgi:hypothetical protein